MGRARRGRGGEPMLRRLLPLLIAAALGTPPAAAAAVDTQPASAPVEAADDIGGVGGSEPAPAAAMSAAVDTPSVPGPALASEASDNIGGIGGADPVAADSGAGVDAGTVSDEIGGIASSGLGEVAQTDSPQPVHSDASRRDGDNDEFGELQQDQRSDAYANSALLPGARFSLKHELAARIRAPNRLANNRTSFRMEYEKYFWDKFYLHFDVIETAFWGKDHRAQARGRNVFTESTVRDAYLQFSQGNTSVKLGNQILIWGESDAGAITDVIAPRNLSELFFISLEESRISQFMLTVDQFTKIGDWSGFYIPDAQFNEYPEPGTAYYLDPFAGNVQVRRRDFDQAEYGLRWKKTFGGSDVGLMAARLVDNDYVYRPDGFGADGLPRVVRDSQRFDMIGATFNHVLGPLLLSGEIAKKSPRAFMTASLTPVLKDEVDTSVRVEYSLGNAGTHSVSLEAVNRRVLDWDRRILPTARDTNSLVLGWSNSFLNETLSANWLTVYNQTYTSYQHSLFLNYKLNGRISLSLDAFYLSVRDRRNDLYAYRGQNNAVLRFLYQF